MSDWVHCNKCFLQPNTSNEVLYLTNCGHIYCNKCCFGGNSEKNYICHLCNSPCTTILLCSNLREDIQCYFTDPDELLQKYTKIVEFQKNHRIRLQSHNTEELQKIQKKYMLIKEEVKKLQRIQSNIQKDNTRLRMMIKRDIGGSPSALLHRNGFSVNDTPVNHTPDSLFHTPANSDQLNKMRGCNNVNNNKINKSNWTHAQMNSNRISLPRPNQYRTNKVSDSLRHNTSSSDLQQNTPSVNSLSATFRGPRTATPPMSLSALSLNSKISSISQIYTRDSKKDKKYN